MEKIVRYHKDLKEGLTDEEVKKRYEEQLVNFNTDVKTKSAKQIIRENALTLFNIINIILAIAIISVGSLKNLSFIFIIILNTVISTFQELNSKRVVDKLSVVSATKIKVIRNGKEEEIALDQVVLDDIIKLSMGNQVITDAIIRQGNVLVDESFITGESEPVEKGEGMMLLSGSFILSGHCLAQVEHVGYDNYTAKISADTKYIKEISSEIMRSLTKIVKTISFVIVPLGVLLFARQLFLADNTFQQAVINTVAAIIGMIPEGLVLLTSTVFAISVIRLSRRKVLVQDLYCIETLARVDVICLDKTGTITEGIMEVKDLLPEANKSKAELGDLIGMMMASIDDQNPTSVALKNAYYSKSSEEIKTVIPFSSITKYSGVTMKNGVTYLLGAPEFLLDNHGKEYEDKLKQWTQEYRVIALIKVPSFDAKKEIHGAEVLAFILLQDKIRKEAKDTLSYFRKQGVAIKIISGDNPDTVLGIARRAGVEVVEENGQKRTLKTIDLSTLKTEAEIAEAALIYDVFGRVKPDEKHILIKALKEASHTVAMTGDGVNDCLALKEADCSIAMASGTDAARSVSQLVLLDSNFASLPKVVDEGRRSINNLERSASLFLVKTIYAGLLAFLFLFIEMSYPFIPIQLTLSSVVTIGIPSFILALEPNHNVVKGNFLGNVLRKAAPPAFVIVCNILLICLLGNMFDLSYAKISTLCLTLTAYTSFILLYKICQPFNRIRLFLFAIMFYAFIFSILNLTTLFSISHFNYLMLGIVFLLTYLSHELYHLFTLLVDRFLERYKRKSIREHKKTLL